MKTILLILTFISGITSYSQNEIKDIIDKLNQNLTTYGADPSLKEVFLNRQEKILDIQGFQIPLEKTKEVYQPDEKIYQGTKIIGKVSFECEWNCIKNTEDNEQNSGVAFSFKSKKGAYLFIDLIFQLKKELAYD
ncbi:hypothetical protein VP395_10920 [Mariniflexile soesokkakense]|uniref:Lumazine-binding protein n=1 Tax=Mariniflexile soesokkakense TaxID=1343160 RepID=A0ABV0AE63_9FLAO